MAAEPSIGEVRARAIDALLACEWRAAADDYCGTDPYDALSAAAVPGWVIRSQLLSRVVLQTVKRSPVDLRPLVRVPPHRIAKGLALFASGYCRLEGVLPGRPWTDKALRLGSDLVSCALDDAGRPCWGYEFDVRTRWSSYDAGTPNVIVTSFAMHALMDVHERLGADTATTIAGAARFLRERLLAHGPEGTYFRYVPDSEVLVHNANMLAAGALARVGALMDDHNAIELALQAAETTLSAASGSEFPPYGAGANIGWVDSYHTGYVIDGLARIVEASAARELGRRLHDWVAAYRQIFFAEDGRPWYGPDRPFPLDIHSAATGVDVLGRIGRDEASLNTAARVLGWVMANMYDGHGGFYFQRGRFLANPTVHVRWNQAHMFHALASYLDVTS